MENETPSSLQSNPFIFQDSINNFFLIHCTPLFCIPRQMASKSISQLTSLLSFLSCIYKDGEWEQNDIKKSYYYYYYVSHQYNNIFDISQVGFTHKNAETTKKNLYFFVLIYSSKTTLTLCFAFETHKNKNIYFSMVPPAGWERNDKRGTRGLKWIFISCFFLSCCCCFFFGFYSMYKNIHRKKKLRRLYNNNNHSLTLSLSHSYYL